MQLPKRAKKSGKRLKLPGSTRRSPPATQSNWWETPSSQLLFSLGTLSGHSMRCNSTDIATNTGACQAYGLLTRGMRLRFYNLPLLIVLSTKMFNYMNSPIDGPVRVIELWALL